VIAVEAKSTQPLWILAGLTAASLLGLLLLRAIPQDQAYHLFADRRTLFGVPNFWNVVSNPALAGCRGDYPRANDSFRIRSSTLLSANGSCDGGPDG
jgi:hypothetical protein